MRAASRGYVKLKSSSPYDNPIIQPNYLSTEEDRVELRDSIRLTREIFSQKAFDPFRGKELQPGKKFAFFFDATCTAFFAAFSPDTIMLSRSSVA